MRLQCPEAFAACEALLDIVLDNHPAGPPSKDTAGDVILRTYARSVKTFPAVLTLAGQGSGEHGLMLVRTLFEDMIIGHWVRRFPAVAEERFHEHRRVVVDRFRQTFATYFGDDEAAGFPEIPEDEREALLASFKPQSMPWTGKYVREMLDDVKNEWSDPRDERLLWQAYGLVYGYANVMLHNNGVSLATMTNVVEGRRQWYLGPSYVHLRDALGGAFFTLGNTATLVFDEATLDALNQVFAEHLPTFVRERAEATPEDGQAPPATDENA